MDFGDGTMERNGMVGKNGWQGGTSEMPAAPAQATRLLEIARTSYYLRLTHNNDSHTACIRQQCVRYFR